VEIGYGKHVDEWAHKRSVLEGPTRYETCTRIDYEMNLKRRGTIWDIPVSKMPAFLTIIEREKKKKNPYIN
jgi:hypothetical protein